MQVTRDSVRKRLAKLAPGRKTSFGYEEGSNFDAGKTRNLILATAKQMGIKVSTRKNATKNTIEVTRTADAMV